MQSNCYRRAVGNSHSMPILCFTWECLSSKPAKRLEARGALNQALAGGLQEPLASEAKRALADLQRE